MWFSVIQNQGKCVFACKIQVIAGLRWLRWLSHLQLRTYWDEKLHSTSFQPRPLGSIAVQVIIFQSKSLFCKAFQMNQSRIGEMERLIYNSYLHAGKKYVFFSFLLLDGDFLKPLTKLAWREWFVEGTVERCGHPLWKRLNLHEYLSRRGWTSRWQASHLLCFMPITRYNKCREHVNEMYRLCGASFQIWYAAMCEEAIAWRMSVGRLSSCSQMTWKGHWTATTL